MTPKIGRRTAMKVTGLLTLVGLASTSGSGHREVRRQPARGRDGPLERDDFTVAIEGETVPGWQSVTIPGVATEQGEYREGDDTDHERKTWGRTTYDDLEMERGVYPGDTRLHDWHRAVLEGRTDHGRKELSVTLLDPQGDPQFRWAFEGAWIAEYDPPELDASADGEVATESVTIAYDKMERTEV